MTYRVLSKSSRLISVSQAAASYAPVVAGLLGCGIQELERSVAPWPATIATVLDDFKAYFKAYFKHSFRPFRGLEAGGDAEKHGRGRRGCRGAYLAASRATRARPGQLR